MDEVIQEYKRFFTHMLHRRYRVNKIKIWSNDKANIGEYGPQGLNFSTVTHQTNSLKANLFYALMISTGISIIENVSKKYSLSSVDSADFNPRSMCEPHSFKPATSKLTD